MRIRDGRVMLTRALAVAAITVVAVAPIACPAANTLSPAEDRAFLVAAACNVAEGYANEFQIYADALAQRADDIRLNAQFASIPNGPSPLPVVDVSNDRDRATAAYPHFEKYMKLCTDAKRHNENAAYYNAAKAAIEYFTNKPWQDSLNLAIQQLTRCQSDYFGTTDGAKCETQIDRLVKQKIKWETTDG
jgi:hypothetical protein